MRYEQIKPYIEKGLVSEQSHPLDPNVKIFNYTQTCQFSKAWDEVTTQCRGLIMNVETGEILARPFRKFFNFGEYAGEIPTEKPIITKKLDGSLGIMYTLQGKTWIATRGSFTSDQAQWATRWWRENKGDEPYGNEVTHLFEIIYPENRIVVSYDFAGLVHLTSVRTETGEDLPDEIIPVHKADRIDAEDWQALKNLNTPNEEGFVLTWPNKLRLKVKFEEYVRLHRIVTGVSEIAIWEMLRDGKPTSEFLEKVPDEFMKWFEGVVTRLKGQYAEIEKEAVDHFARITDLMGSALVGGGSRKEWAEQIQRMKNPGLGFSMLDKKDYSTAIWRMVRPHGQSIFKTDIDL